MGVGVRRTILIGAVGALAAVAAVDAVWRRYVFPEWLVPLRERFQSELSTVRPDDGIDAREAQQIAHLYMLEYTSGCGAPMEPRLHDGTWTFPLRLGVAGRLSDRVVRVDARTGAVASPGGLAFPSFHAFSQDLIDGIAIRRR
jgi:hypothetical protein